MSPDSVNALLTRRGAPLAAVTIEPVGEGDFFRAYRVDGEWALRIAKHPEAAAALMRECRLLPRLAPTLPLAVPRPGFSSDAQDGDPAFALHPWLPGPVLTRDRYLTLPEPARERCAGAVGHFLARLHATELALPRECGVPEVDYHARYAELLERARTGLWSRLAGEERQWIEAILVDFLARDEATVPCVLLHGDLSPDHVLYGEEAAQVTGVLDFGDAAIGDPAWDLVYLYEDYGADFLARALRAYPPAEDPGRLLRMQRYLELDAVQWAVGCAEGGEDEELGEAVTYLRTLRERAEAEARPLLHD